MPTAKERQQSLDRFVKAQMRRLAVPGVAVGILHRGRRYMQGYGVTNVDHPLPVTADTLFQIGSTTKTYTATAIMRLVEQGRLDLHVPLRRYLPDLRLRNKQAEREATLWHVLTHTGGWLGDHFPESLVSRGDDALDEVVASMSKIKQLTPLGKVFSYNNAGFYVAGRVIEKVTKQPYDKAVQELVLDPLGMTRSFWFAEDLITQRFVVGHMSDGKKATVAKPWALRRSANPAGGITADVNDQLTWAAFHMGDGRAPDGKRLLKKSTLSQMQRAQAPAGSLCDDVGLSWLLRTVDGTKLVSHGGTTIGQLAAFLMAPEHEFAMTVLTNATTGGQLHRAVVNHALEHWIGVSREPEAPVEMPRKALNEYAGPYRMESTDSTFDLTVRNGGLVVKMPRPPADDKGKQPPAPKPAPMVFIGPDRVVGTEGYLKGIHGEFIRDSKGRITWFRFGGRIQRKVDA